MRKACVFVEPGIIRDPACWRLCRYRHNRHTFAVRALLHWYQTRADIDTHIATLATYLGHVNVTDTYWYLSAVPELMAIGASRFETFAESGGRS